MTDDEQRGELVLVDDTDGGYAIYWNRSATFSVFSILGNAVSFRPLREVNVFTHYDVAGKDDAQRIAADWWQDYGRENTALIEREGLS
jgi:hypothetical protein